MNAKLVRWICSYLLTAAFAPGLILSLPAQTKPPNAQTPLGESSPTSDSGRQHAIELYRQGKNVEAMPLFEILCAQYPGDNAMWEAWGVTTLGYSQILPDADQRKKNRALARSRLAKAKELGDNSNLLQILLSELPEDGGEGTYSPRKDVNDIMQQAEADFSRGDYDKARDGYLHALLLDPNNYDAALFMGDVFFKQHINGSAGEWFARAIQIDPNRETAYRYWGDALWGLGKSADAREKYIQAIVAEPYGNKSWVGLTQWAQRSKVNLDWLRLQDKGSVTQKDDTHINITIDEDSLKKKNDPSSSAWMMYSMERALWHGDKFKKEFPNETNYRRTMREEADCLHLMVSVMTGQKGFEKRKKNMDSSLLQLVQIDQAGFLEPFALLNRADKEIAQDYIPYRNAHRETIYRYFDEYVVPKVPPQ
ncbi:MAG: tetratricopeptide repeat protein [Candidatus Sulfotelmatobacter sp.]